MDKVIMIETGEVWVFGSGYSGKIGTDDNKSTSSPKTMCGLSKVNIIQIAAGGANTMRRMFFIFHRTSSK